MTLDDLYPLYEADRGTLSTEGQRSFLKEVQAQGLTYVPYAQRVGPGFATAASELKRALDAAVLPAFQDVVSRVTDQRFKQVYCDVRLYPQGLELAHWAEGNWAGERLTVMVAFVLSIAPGDSLDSMARASLLSLFEESSWSRAKALDRSGATASIVAESSSVWRICSACSRFSGSPLRSFFRAVASLLAFAALDLAAGWAALLGAGARCGGASKSYLRHRRAWSLRM